MKVAKISINFPIKLSEKMRDHLISMGFSISKFNNRIWEADINEKTLDYAIKCNERYETRVSAIVTFFKQPPKEVLQEIKKIGFIFSQKLLVLSMRSLAGAAYWYFMFLSISYSSLFDTSTLINLCPIWVLIISSLFFDKITIKNDIFFVAILGFIGSIFIIISIICIYNFWCFGIIC